MTVPIYFITVNYYCSNLIRELINTTANLSNRNYEFIVVNNSPQDLGVQSLQLLPKVRIIQSQRNLGFGGACNLALEQVYTQDPNGLAWLINPDARLIKDAIDYVRQCIEEDPEIAILGTRICDLEGNLWFSHGTFNPWLGTLTHNDNNVSCDLDPVTTHPTRWISGCSMIFNLATLGHCPKFDLRYFLDYEDVDMSESYYRQGYRLRVTQAVLVSHQVSAITGRHPKAKYRHGAFSKLYFLERHGTTLALVLNLVYFALRPLTFTSRSFAMIQGRWAGLLDYLHWRWQKIWGNYAWKHPKTSYTADTY
jgi:N-acetylglucosaminyl-diphospho-decaprenol L-rhamnosyltransferase